MSGPPDKPYRTQVSVREVSPTEFFVVLAIRCNGVTLEEQLRGPFSKEDAIKRALELHTEILLLGAVPIAGTS